MSASSEVVADVVLPADLHARPAGQVTRTVAALDAVVHLSAREGSEVDARSVLAVMGLGAVAGDTVRVRASGPDASAAVTAVTALRAAAFGANLSRLTQVKDQFDPGNLFRLNNNIPPSRTIDLPGQRITVASEKASSS